MPSCLSRALRTLLSVAVLAALAPTAAHAQEADSVVRSSGPNRIATAVMASRDHRDQASEALLATSSSFPDALAAGALANRLGAPLLLTDRYSLPAIVREELIRLGVRRVTVLGGVAAVSTGVEDELTGVGIQVRRIAGDSRYATAASIAQAAGPSATGEVVVAVGEHDDPDRAWPDAVASGALAATPDRVPTLLTRPGSLPAETEQALAALGATRVLLLGGERAIAPAVEARLRQLGYDVVRLAGSSRYETSVQLAAEALARFPDDSRPAVFASGQNFPDALSAGSLAASLGAPLLLVPPHQLGESTDDFLRAHHLRLVHGVLVGGPAAAGDQVLEQIAAAIGNEPRVVGTFSGNASWYGPGFHGRPTASGEIYDQNALTAAHRTLPFGTILRVTNAHNGRQVIVRINDRGPYHSNRSLDLSSAAADQVDMKHDGVIPFTAEILEY